MLLIDTAEPLEIEHLLKQTAEVTKTKLNQLGMSDYYMLGAPDNVTRQFARVQAGELLSNIDSQEQELRKYYNNADRNYLIIEGIISCIPLTKKPKNPDAVTTRQIAHPTRLFTYSVSESGYIFNEHAYDVSLSLLTAWLFRLDECGISHFRTINYIETAKLLSAIYKNMQKPPEEHSTLLRYIKPRIRINPYNPHVVTLMGIAGAELGETRARALIDWFGSAIAVFIASPSELCEVEGIGKTTARKLTKAIGRED